MDGAQIRSGGLFDVMNPDPARINIEDIAHSLAMQCRFNGHCARFYSVAEHSVHVSRVADQLLPGTARRGVLHDAHETYTGDMIYPLKHSGDFDRFLELEDELQAVVYRKFGVAEDDLSDQVIHAADMAMVQIERLQLFPRTSEADEAWDRIEADPSIVPEHCWPQCWPPEVARTLFLDRFREVS